MYPNYDYYDYLRFERRYGKVTTPKEYGQILLKKKKRGRKCN